MPILPEQLIKSLCNLDDFDAKAFERAHQNKSVVSIRKNPFKNADLSFSGKEIPWCKEGLILEERPGFTNDPLFHAGAYYVQEASSMFLDHVLKNLPLENNQLKVLDLCGSPGGKSTNILSWLNKRGYLVTNEIIASRANVLVQNITKWGLNNVLVTNSKPSDFSRLSGFFDLVLVDAPCSGSGLFRKIPEYISEWTPEMVSACAVRQKDILDSALQAVKEGGVLVYSTCSYSFEENEEICDWIIDHNGFNAVDINLNELKGIRTSKNEKNNRISYRFSPENIEGEGFFISVFKNVQQPNNGKLKTKKLNVDKVGSNEKKILFNYLKEDTENLYRWNNKFHLLNNELFADIDLLSNYLRFFKVGVSMGEILHNELLPDPELALSIDLSEKVARIELETKEIQEYLRGNALKSDFDKKGWVLVCQNKLGLGWAKATQGRMNNYYPKSWRILKPLEY